MALASVFSLPFKHQLTFDYPSSSSSKLTKKRKRGMRESNGQNNPNSPTAGEQERILGSRSPSQAERLAAAAYLDVDKRHENELHVSQGSFDQNIFRPSFPHAASVLKNEITTEPSDWLNRELSTLKPPLYAPDKICQIKRAKNGAFAFEGFRRQHLASLTTVLHRCISEGDYLRAGRAWAILIRFQMNGNSVDIRNGDLWGIGAEILHQRLVLWDEQLRKDKFSRAQKVDENSDAELVGNRSISKQIYSRGGFQEAQDYYERLSLQYPHEVFSNTVSALDFRPASLISWIWSLHHHKGHPEHIKSKQTQDHIDDSDNAAVSISKPIILDSSSQRYLREVNTSSDSFRHRDEIIQRLDELLSSPPHSDDPRLWNIQGMIALWIGDLSTTHGPEESGFGTVDEDEQIGDNYKNVVWEDARPNLTKSQALEKAAGAFENATRLRNRIPASIDG